MKVINLDSKVELTPAQISFAKAVIIGGENFPFLPEIGKISALMNQIPVFLLAPESMPDEYRIDIGWFDEKEKHSKNDEREYRGNEKPSTEWLGFFQYPYKILSIDTPIIALCPERIIKCVNTEEELCIAIAKVLIHEFAHASMRHSPNANYSPKDEFYRWMEEPLANAITLHYFNSYDKGINDNYLFGLREKAKIRSATSITSTLYFVKLFISQQPDNYRLGSDIYKHDFHFWRQWRTYKHSIQKRLKEQHDWLDYVRANYRHTDRATLEQLFDALYK